MNADTNQQSTLRKTNENDEHDAQQSETEAVTSDKPSPLPPPLPPEAATPPPLLPEQVAGESGAEPMAMPYEADRPAQQEERSTNKKGIWAGVLVALGFVVTKLKFLLGPLYFAFKALKFGKFLTTGLSMVLMIVTYAFMYGWKYAIGVVVLLFVHEMGHLWFAKIKRLDVSLPVFIPFVGALIKLKEEPKDAKTEAFVAVGGPLIGMLGAFVFLLAAFWQHSQLLAALAYFGFFLTVFNMIPAHPLDGGRIAAALSPAMWLLGIISMAVLTIYYFNPLAFMILLFAIGKAWSVWKHRHEQPPGYYEVDTAFRVKMGITYFTIFAVSSFFTYFLHAILQR